MFREFRRARSIGLGGILAAGLTTLDFAAAQVPATTADLSVAAGGLAAAEDMSRDKIVAEDAWYDRHELALGVDGNLPGNIRVFDDSGKLTPARVKLYFLQKGAVVAQSTPTEEGDFQVVGLKSGTYSVVAAGQSGFAAMGVRVLPPPERPDAPKANTIGRIRTVSEPSLGTGLSLNVPVIPAADVIPAVSLGSMNNAGGLGNVPGLQSLGSSVPGLGSAAGAGGGSASLGGGIVGGGGGGIGAGAGAGAAGAAGSGLGGIIAAGGIAGAASLAVQNDDDNSSSGGTVASPSGM